MSFSPLIYSFQNILFVINKESKQYAKRQKKKKKAYQISNQVHWNNALKHKIIKKKPTKHKIIGFLTEVYSLNLQFMKLQKLILEIIIFLKVLNVTLRENEIVFSYKALKSAL